MRIVSGIVLMLLLTSMLSSAFDIQPVDAGTIPSTLTTMNVLAPVLPSDMPVVYVDPPIVSASIGEPFTVSVKIFNLSDNFYTSNEAWTPGGPLPPYDPDAGGYNYSLGNLYALHIQFRWDPTLLEYVNHTVKIPVENYANGVLHEPIVDIVDSVDAGAGTYEVAKSSHGRTSVFNSAGENATVFNMTFNVKKRGKCDLELTSVDLAQPFPWPEFEDAQPMIPHWIRSAQFHAGTIIIPDDYSTIQAGIDAANPGYIIYVRDGIYYEHLKVNKSLSLVAESKENTIVDGSGENQTVIEATAPNVAISGFTVQNTSLEAGTSFAGIKVSGSSCNITRNLVTNTKIGIFVTSQKSRIMENVAENNGQGIALHSSSEVTVEANNLSGNTVGISLAHSFNNTIVGNNAVNSSTGGHGITLSSNSLNNTIRANKLLSNYHGMWLSSSHNNSILENIIANNMLLGIELADSSDNSFFHNDFLNNGLPPLAPSIKHIVIDGKSTSLWDDGYPSGGNYWSDHIGNDLLSGPYQNETGSDGIVDTPYVIDGNNTDNYPLVNPYSATPSNQPPTAYIDSIFPNPAIEGQTVRFQGHGTDVDGYIVGYLWESDKDGFLTNQASFDTSTLSMNTHRVSFKVKDNNGTWSSADIEILDINPKSNQPPTAFIDSISPNPSVEGETVAFQGHGEDSDGSITEYNWSSSIDGFLSSSASFTTSSLSIGEHEIDFKVKDNGGAWSETILETISVRVTPDWNTIAETASLRREKYAYYDDLFDSGWWHDVAMDQIDPYASLFDPLKAVAGELSGLLLEYFADLGITGPISIIKYSYDISTRLVSLFQALYYDEIAATLGSAYAQYNIKTDVSTLLDAIDAVITAANSQDIVALDQAFMQEKQATETVYVGTKKFDNAIMAVLEENSIWSSTTRTKIYLELRGYLVGLHSALEENYSYLTQELDETKDLAEEKPEGSFTPRHNLPIVEDGYWQVDGQNTTEAEVDEPVTTFVTLKNINISRTDYDKVQGTVTVYIKKDFAFLPDETYVQQSFEVTVEAAKIEQISFSFTPDQKSSLWMRGYYLEVEFTGHYLILGITVENRLVQWTHGGYQMQNSYPPRLRAVQDGTVELSGTVVTLKETQHKLYLQIYDSQHRHVGISHEVDQKEIEIPKAEYLDFENGTIVAILPSNTKDFTVVVDARYAEEAHETYTLTINTVNDEQVVSQKELQSTISRGTQNRYTIEVSESGEISLVEENRIFFLWWTLSVLAVVTLAFGITLVIWKRGRSKT